MTRQATYQSGEEPRAGDLVRYNGPTKRMFGLETGKTYEVERQSTVHGHGDRQFLFVKGIQGGWYVEDFSLVQRKEGEP